MPVAIRHAELGILSVIPIEPVLARRLILWFGIEFAKWSQFVREANVVEAGAEEREAVSDGEAAKLDASRTIQVLGGRKIVNLCLVNPAVVWTACESPPIPRMMGATSKNK